MGKGTQGAPVDPVQGGAAQLRHRRSRHIPLKGGHAEALQVKLPLAHRHQHKTEAVGFKTHHLPPLPSGQQEVDRILHMHIGEGKKIAGAIFTESDNDLAVGGGFHR